MTAIRSRDLLPALVTMENSTALPSLSRKVSFCNVNPPACSRWSAAWVEYDSALRWLLNQNLFAGETGPTPGWACPLNTTRLRSARLIASETARRKLVERNQFRLYAGMGAFATWLNHMNSESSEAPASCTTDGELAASRS